MVKPDVIAREFSKSEILEFLNALLPGIHVNLIHYQFLFGGLSTTTIKVHVQLDPGSDETMILKVFYPNNPGRETIQSAMDMCAYIHTACPTLPVVHPVHGSNVHVVELKSGFSSPCILLNYLANTVAADRAIASGHVVRGAVMRQLGLALGQLHAIPVPDTEPKLSTFEAGGAVDLAKHAQCEFLQEVLSKGNAAFSKLYERIIKSDFVNLLSTPQGIIHGDPFLDNVLLDKSSFLLAGLVDFEDACIGPLLFDIGSSIAGNCWIDAGGAYSLDWDAITAFIGGYMTARHLPKEDLRMIPRFVRIALACNAAFRFLVYYGTGNNDNAYLELMGKLQYMCQHTADIQERFAWLD